MSSTPAAPTPITGTVQLIHRRPYAKYGDVVFDPMPHAEATDALREHLGHEIGLSVEDDHYQEVERLLASGELKAAFDLARNCSEDDEINEDSLEVRHHR